MAPPDQHDFEPIEVIENLKSETTVISGTPPMPSTISDGTVWKLLNNTEIDASTGDPNQIIYVTYQDPNDPGNNKTMQVLSNVVSIFFFVFSLSIIHHQRFLFPLTEWFRLFEYWWHI